MIWNLKKQKSKYMEKTLNIIEILKKTVNPEFLAWCIDDEDMLMKLESFAENYISLRKRILNNNHSIDKLRKEGVILLLAIFWSYNIDNLKWVTKKVQVKWLSSFLFRSKPEYVTTLFYEWIEVEVINIWWYDIRIDSIDNYLILNKLAAVWNEVKVLYNLENNVSVKEEYRKKLIFDIIKNTNFSAKGFNSKDFFENLIKLWLTPDEVYKFKQFWRLAHPFNIFKKHFIHHLINKLWLADYIKSLSWGLSTEEVVKSLIDFWKWLLSNVSTVIRTTHNLFKLSEIKIIYSDCQICLFSFWFKIW